MKHKAAPELLIEWAPGRVRSYDPLTGAEREASTIAELRAASGGPSRAVVGISRDRVFLRVMALPKASPEDLRRIASAQIGQSFPMPATEMAYDVVQAPERSGDGWPTLVAAVRTGDLRQLLVDLRAAGLSAARIVPVALTSPVLAAAAGASEALVVEPLPHGLALDVVRDGVLHLSRVAPEGCDADIEIQRTLAAAGSDTIQVVRAGAVEPSGRSLARLGDVARTFHFELPEEQERLVQSRAASRTRLAVLSAVVALLLMGVAWTDYATAVSAANKATERTAKDLKIARTANDAQTKRAKDATDAKTVMHQALDPGQPLSDMLAVASDRLPQGVWLTAATAERGKEIQLRGTSARSSGIAEYMAALGGSPRLADARLVAANSAKIGQKPVVQFTISVVGMGNPTMPQAAKQGRKSTKAQTSTSDGGQS